MPPFHPDHDLAAIIRQSPAILHCLPYHYAQLPANAQPPGEAVAQAFAVLRDELETTVVAPMNPSLQRAALAVQGPFRLIEFVMSMPFEGPGFLAAIASALAERRINVLLHCTFSRDVLLVAERDLDESLDALAALGFTIRTA